MALPYAEELAARLGCDISLVYISESNEDQYRHMHQSYLDKIIEIVKRGAAGYLKEATENTFHISSKIIVGNAAEEIVDYAEKADVGLIVMSTHARSGVKRWTLGSVAEKVVRATNRPVALIRTTDARPDLPEKRLLTKILVPLDGSKLGEAAVRCVTEIASRLKAEVILFQVLASGYLAITADGYGYVMNTEQQMESDKAFATAYLQQVGAPLKQEGISVKAEIRFGNAAEEIVRFADKKQVDLVAMSTHGRSGVGRWVFGSVAEKILYQGNTPLLLVRAPAAAGK